MIFRYFTVKNKIGHPVHVCSVPVTPMRSIGHPQRYAIELGFLSVSSTEPKFCLTLRLLLGLCVSRLFLGARTCVYLVDRLHSNAFLVMSCISFLSVCPIHFHFLSLISLSMSLGACLHRFHSRLLLMVLGQKILHILRKHRFTNTCNMLIMFFVNRQVSHSYSNTDFTLELKTRSFVFLLS